MAKKRYTISIDEELAGKLDNTGLNLSQLVNDYLVDFFELEGKSIHEINREIRDKEEVVRATVIEIEKLQKMRKQEFPFTEEAKQQQIWQDFRIELNRCIRNKLTESEFDEVLKIDAEEVLGYGFVDLCMMCVMFFNRASSFDCRLEDSDNWEVIVDEYSKDDFYSPKHFRHHLKNFFGR